jgi:hypothetical protein
MNMEIPLLKSSDIECRVQQVKQSWDKKSVEAVLLLYKDARCDMRYLDMLYGVSGWQRHHRLIGDRLYCTVEVWDENKQQWIAKEDVGTESNTEKEKGQASDAFKRACFNIGIGRELYTAPLIKITLNEKEYSKDDNSGKYKSFASFTVKEIEYDDERQISNLVIVDRFGNVRYTYQQGKTDTQTPKKQATPKKQPTAREKLIVKLKEKGIDATEYAKEKGLSGKTTAAEFEKLLAELEE